MSQKQEPHSLYRVFLIFYYSLIGRNDFCSRIYLGSSGSSFVWLVFHALFVVLLKFDRVSLGLDGNFMAFPCFCFLLGFLWIVCGNEVEVAEAKKKEKRKVSPRSGQFVAFVSCYSFPFLSSSLFHISFLLIQIDAMKLIRNTPIIDIERRVSCWSSLCLLVIEKYDFLIPVSDLQPEKDIYRFNPMVRYDYNKTLAEYVIVRKGQPWRTLVEWKFVSNPKMNMKKNGEKKQIVKKTDHFHCRLRVERLFTGSTMMKNHSILLMPRKSRRKGQNAGTTKRNEGKRYNLCNRNNSR